MMNRRQFLVSSAAILAGAVCIPPLADQLVVGVDAAGLSGDFAFVYLYGVDWNGLPRVTEIHPGIYRLLGPGDADHHFGTVYAVSYVSHDGEVYMIDERPLDRSEDAETARAAQRRHRDFVRDWSAEARRTVFHVDDGWPV